MTAPLNLAAAARAFPRAARLAVYDGRARLGTVLDTRGLERRAPAALAYAFDAAGDLVGTFATRKEAAAALPGGSR